MKIGSLFSGYGGLDMGVMSVLGGEVAWHVEFDAAPSKILEHHWPDVPNYGDVAAVGWASVEPVDILTGGFPCQDVSLAGRRAGMKDGTRSGLWSEYAKAIDELRPSLVVIENVRGLLSAAAGSDMEPCPWCVGDNEGEPCLRALGAVLGDLADLGYDARWVGVRAADAGAPHGRFRVFIVAHPQGVSWGVGDGDDVRAGRGAVGRESTAGRGSDADPADDGHERPGSAWERWRGPQDDHQPLAHSGRGGREVGSKQHGESDEIAADRTPRGEHAHGHIRGTDTTWREYAPAITRWENVVGGVAPSPTNPDGRNGQQRLSAPFVEWMMGLPAGHVTSPAIGLTRAQQLKALGNGVVPQQAALALRLLEVSHV